MTPPTRPPPAFDRPAVAALGLTAAVFAFDLSLPLGVAAAVPYTFAVLLALRSAARRAALVVAALCGVLTVAKMVLVPEYGTTEVWKVVANRGLALFAIGMTLFLGVRRRQAETDRAGAEEKVREHLADLARLGRVSTAGQLATGLAHELNQPLAAVCLYAEMAERLVETGAAAGDVLPALREVNEQAHRAAEIVRGLRRMIRSEPPAITPVDLTEVVRTVARLLEPHALRAAADIRLDLAAVPLVSGDRVQLEQVVFNLLQNAVEAVEAIPDGPRRVIITTATDDAGLVAVSVRDTGIGLPAGAEIRVFERFFTTRREGIGMGLAISRSIVEAHGGRIAVLRIPGGGAVFTVELPVVRE